MAKLPDQADVLILGDHPSSFLAAALLRQKSKLRVIHASFSRSGDLDRLVRINPALFDLHPILSPLKRKIAQTVLYGVQFLSSDGQTRSEWRERGTVITVAGMKSVREAMTKLAEEREVHLCQAKSLMIDGIDEQGADVRINSSRTRVKAMIISDGLDVGSERLLNLPASPDQTTVHRLSWVRIKGAQKLQSSGKPLATVCLDMHGQQAAGWLLPGKTGGQLMVIQPIGQVQQSPPSTVLRAWANTLVQHEILASADAVDWSNPQWLDIPLAGALAREGVANRTLLIGPAAGFYSASGEDIYPNCWSAVHAAEVMKKSLRERHLQDALNAYRARWRTTLGDYLRGPQQNLQFLLPLVYRNPVMTQRLGEAILLGKGIVR